MSDDLAKENAELLQRLVDAEKELAEIRGKLNKFGEIFAKDQWLLNHAEIKQEFKEIFGGE